MSPAPALVAGRYRLQSRIADGGMGVVWRAMDEVLNRPVAVKLLRREFAGHPQTLSRFAAEARLAASVRHPGIAEVYDYGTSGRRGSPYLVMELVDGPSLERLLAAGPLGPAATMDMVAQTAAGLAAAHQAGLVHRDVKPGNLLIGPDGAVKITDFGIAYAAGSAPITETGVLMGTAAYMAPERTLGRPATPASDLYSLGIAAYECLTGAPPFTGTALDVAFAHQHSPLPPLPPWVPVEAAALIADLAAKDPAGRPASAAEAAGRAARLRDAVPGDAVPGDAVPGDAVPGEGVPGEGLPGLALPDGAPVVPPAPGQARGGEDAPVTEAALDVEAGLDAATRALTVRPAPRYAGRSARLPRHRRRRSRSTMLLAAAGTAVIAVLAGWAATSGPGTVAGAPGARPAPAGRERTGPATRPAARPRSAAASPSAAPGAGRTAGPLPGPAASAGRATPTVPASVAPAGPSANPAGHNPPGRQRGHGPG